MPSLCSKKQFDNCFSHQFAQAPVMFQAEQSKNITSRSASMNRARMEPKYEEFYQCSTEAFLQTDISRLEGNGFMDIAFKFNPFLICYLVKFHNKTIPEK